ncbi:hypothetical protein FZW96_14470 [Bacillus sp. BGMRC 2118]|nr:hypothetical protein FZW96_14470 [Bacillus sp. BGMRC 2118]
MKRNMLVPITLLLMILVTACTHYSSTPISPKEDSMVINITNNTDFELYGVQVQVGNHSVTGVNADSSKIEKGETLSFELLQEDIALTGNVEVKVEILENVTSHKSVPINQKVTLELDPNNAVFYKLTGESIREAKLSRIKE